MLLVERQDAVAVVTLNRPEAMNALSKALRAALRQAMVELDADANVKVVVLTGAGERAFTAGLDLKELSTDPLGMGAANAVDPAENPARAVLACSKPIVGAINGVAITGGFEVALACDVLICSTNARFADTHARVGITPGWGLSQKLSRAIGPYRAKELSLTGNFLSAQQAYDWGLVNRVVEPAELMPAALKLAHEMASIEAEMLVTYKAMIDDGYARWPWAKALAAGTHDRSGDRPQRRRVTPEDGRSAPRSGSGARADAVEPRQLSEISSMASSPTWGVGDAAGDRWFHSERCCGRSRPRKGAATRRVLAGVALTAFLILP